MMLAIIANVKWNALRVIIRKREREKELLLTSALE